jgi:hypothetical protein
MRNTRMETTVTAMAATASRSAAADGGVPAIAKKPGRVGVLLCCSHGKRSQTKRESDGTGDQNLPRNNTEDRIT